MKQKLVLISTLALSLQVSAKDDLMLECKPTDVANKLPANTLVLDLNKNSKDGVAHFINKESKDSYYFLSDGTFFTILLSRNEETKTDASRWLSKELKINRITGDFVYKQKPALNISTNTSKSIQFSGICTKSNFKTKF